MTWTETLPPTQRPRLPTLTPAPTCRTGSSCRSRRGSRWRCATRTPIRRTRAPPRVTPTPRTRARRAPARTGSPVAAARSWNAVLSARLRAQRGRGQLRQHPLVLGPHHRQSGVHLPGAPSVTGTARTGELRLRPAQRRTSRATQPAGGEPGHAYPERRDPADEPGRQARHPHGRRTGAESERGESIRGRDTRSHHPPVRLHPGLGQERVHEQRSAQLRGHAVQLPARVQHRQPREHHAVGGPRDRHQHAVRDRSLGAVHDPDRRSGAVHAVRWGHRHDVPPLQRRLRGHRSGR